MRIGFFGDSITRGSPGASYVEILRRELPDAVIVNQGRGGETIAGLRRRILGVSWEQLFDISFVWIGVNDVIFNIDWTSTFADRPLRHPWRDLIAELDGFYANLLEDLLAFSRTVVAIPPLLVGEDPAGSYNRVLDVLAIGIERLTSQYDSAQFLDLRPEFAKKMEKRSAAAMKAREAMSPDGTAGDWQGNLHFTIDGVHLSEAGAKLAAKMILKKIKALSAESGK